MFNEELPLRWKRVEQTRRVIGSMVLRDSMPLDVAAWKHAAKASFDQRKDGTIIPLTEGQTWGDGKDRLWLHVSGSIPASWKNRRILLWIDTGTEALVYTAEGIILHGLTSGEFFTHTPWKMSRPVIDVTEHMQPGQPFTFWVEAACLSHPWEETFGDPVPPVLSVAGFPHGNLKHAQVGWLDETAWHLYMDMEVLTSLAQALPETSVRRARILRALNLACDQFGRDAADLAAVRALLRPALEAPAHASAITVRATGHAHLDTAWLWTLSVAREKAARTFSNQLALLDRYPEYVFGASSALHYQWIKEDHPDLYQRIKQRVVEGRWEIQGAMWIEADTSMPSGESLIRQFLYGTKFFREEFGVEPDLLWLPDVFGYSAALPQIMRICGVKSMLTQKISWSQFNKFPHHTFLWEGIDGSDVLVHFPPEDNYCSSLVAEELIKAEQRFAENDRLDQMLSLFGYGDGGGGPTPFHLERARRLHDLEGAPKVETGRADTLFAYFHKNAAVLNRWVGELYLELHRKTLTTQAFIKHANRRMEERLVTLEMLWSIMPDHYPSEEIESLWKTLLVHQFHDIIPGSSIREVYEDARATLDAAFRAIALSEAAWADAALAPAPDRLTLFNPLSIPYADLIALPDDWRDATLIAADGAVLPSQSDDTTTWVSVRLPPLSFTSFTRGPATTPSTPARAELVLENDQVRYTFNDQGRLTGIFDNATGRAYMADGQQGNRLCLYGDRPAQWEAWDMDVYYEDELIEQARCTSISGVVQGPVFSQFTVSYTTGAASSIRQTIRLRRDSARLDFITEVDWHETRRLLRVHFPTAMLSDHATYDIQCGTIKRPTHRNTARDMAMFEVCGHRYADLSQPDAGVALLNDSKYGYRVLGNELSLTLLAAPMVPDPDADRGAHGFTFSVLPHPGDHTHPTVQQEAAALNTKPLAWQDQMPADVLSLPVRLTGEGLRLEALKRAEDGAGWIVRVSETAGRQSSGHLKFSRPAVITEVTAVEQPTESSGADPTGREDITLAPFQIKTWKFNRRAGA